MIKPLAEFRCGETPEQTVARLFKNIDEMLANFLNPDVSDLDPELLELARKVIAVREKRGD